MAALELASGPAWAHVAFQDLEPGTRLLAGSTVELVWVDTVRHDTTAYQLEFIPSEGAAAIPVAADIPADQHALSWQIPAAACMDCSLHIIQVNTGSSYSATLPITIVLDAGELTVDGGVILDDREATGMHLPDAAQAGAGGASALASAGMGSAGMGSAGLDPAGMGLAGTGGWEGTAAGAAGAAGVAGGAANDPWTGMGTAGASAAITSDVPATTCAVAAGARSTPVSNPAVLGWLLAAALVYVRRRAPSQT